MSGLNNNELSRLPMVGEVVAESRDPNSNETSSERTRAISEVFLPSVDISMDPNGDSPASPKTNNRTHLDSGYQTGISTSSADTEQHNSPPAHFYISQNSMESEQLQTEEEFQDIDILLETSGISYSNTSDQDDDFSEDYLDSGASVKTLCEEEITSSRPMNIPSASSFHQAYDLAHRLMDATPPRSYITQAMTTTDHSDPTTDHSDPTTVNITGHHFSTGCLSSYSALSTRLANEKVMKCAQYLERGLRVTSGHMHASNSRSNVRELQRQRTISDSEAGHQNYTSLPHRDRSMSAPDIGWKRRQIEKQCATDLRQISDQFFEEFTRVKGKAPRPANNGAPVSKTTQASSYPGTSSRQWWWQTIIQNLSLARARKRDTEATSSAMATIVDSEDEH